MVVAIDDLKQTHQDTYKAFEIAKSILGSRVQYKIMSVYDLDQLDLTFDIVLFYDVYYHLENPIHALRKIYEKTKDFLILSGIVTEDSRPVAYLYNPRELNPLDDTIWFGASVSCLIRMCERVGFKRIEYVSSFHERALLKAFKS